MYSFNEEEKALIKNYLKNTKCIENNNYVLEQIDYNIVSKMENMHKYLEKALRSYNKNPYYNKYKNESFNAPANQEAKKFLEEILNNSKALKRNPLSHEEN